MSDGNRTFHWSDCAGVLEELAVDHALVLDEKRRLFAAPGLRVHPPLVFPVGPTCHSLDDYLDLLPQVPGRQTVILMQAGAVSLGRFRAGEEQATKSFKRYVVRGKGRAQPTQLAGKGKSRYGSRLRLQNARRLFEETVEKLNEWESEFGPAQEVFYSSPQRLWPSLFDAKTKPPFQKGDDHLLRIPLDLPKPTTDILQRTYRKLGFGRIEFLDEAPEEVTRGNRR